MDVLNTHLDVSAMLDPRTEEFKQAVRLTPATLAYHRTGGKWIPATHLLYAASEIAYELSQGDARIIIEMPPRHGKSELASVHTPTWFLDRWPDCNVILTTYAAELSEGFGRRVRDGFLEDDGQFLKARVREDVSRVSLFLTQQGGGMMAAGIGGPITGRGAHLLIIDDYVKNFTEAMSDTTNESIWNWFTTVAYTRLEPGGSVIILATRWAKNDLIGRILEKEGHKWRRIRLPALAEASDPLGRGPGDALWPARYAREKLLAIQSLLGWMFNAMYQQNPVAQEDMVVDPEGLKYIDSIEQANHLRWVRSWDLAATKNGGDYTVGTLIGTDGKPGNPFCKTIIADQIRKQLAPHKVEELMRKTADDDGHHIPVTIEQEPGSSGKIAAEHIANNVLRGFRVTINPAAGHSKAARNQPYLTAVSHGRITLLRSAWNRHHKAELKEWPNGKHDDTIDSAAQGYNFLHQGLLLTPTWGRDLDKMVTLPSGIVIPDRPLKPHNHKLVTGATWGRR